MSTEFERLAARVPRLFTDRHALLMYGLVRWLGARSAVETGAWHGYTSAFIAKGIQDNGGGMLWCIDDFSLGNTAAELHNNLAELGVSQTVRVVSADSKRLERFPACEFAFLDGDHSLEGCAGDFNKAVAAGARCVCLHDTASWWGPRDFMERFRKEAEGWDVLEGFHDQGFAVLLARGERPPVAYSQKDHPTGDIGKTNA